MLISFFLSNRVFINRFLKIFGSLAIFSSLFRLFQSLIDINENDRSASEELVYMGQHRFNLPYRVFLEWTSKFS